MNILFATSLVLFQLLGNCLKAANGDESLKHRLYQGLKHKAAKDIRFLPEIKGKKTPKGSPKGSPQGGVGGCSVCWDGAEVSNPNAFVPLGNNNATCSEVDSFLRAFVQPSETMCMSAQQEGLVDICGCPSCPGICPQGDKFSYPDRIVPFDVNENGLYDDTCTDLNALVQSSPDGNEACYRGSYASEYCGCKSYNPVCTPCYDNFVMPDYNRVIFAGNSTINYMTCGDLATASVVSVESNTFECASTQFSAFVGCGCPSLPPAYESKCTLCFPNETLSSSTDPILPDLTCGYLNGFISAMGSILLDNSCDSALFINFLLEIILPNGRATCCTSKSPKHGKATKGKKTASKEKIQSAENELKKTISSMKKKMFSK